MSLAADILKVRCDLSPPSPYKPNRECLPTARRSGRKQPEPTPKAVMAQPKVKGIYHMREHNMWLVKVHDGSQTRHLGIYYTQARAVVALKLYRYWRRQGLTDIPRQPSTKIRKCPYTRPT